MSAKSIAIVGAGLMGRLLAWQRLGLGDSVTLIDKGDRRSRESAALTAAAMIAPYTEAVVKDPFIFELGTVGLQLWPNLIREIQQHSGHHIYFEQKGTLVVSHSADKSDWIGFNEMAVARLGG